MATIPVEITWTTGQVVTAAQLNANVRDAINFLLAPPMAVLRQTVAQALATGTFLGINYDIEDLDRDNGHSTVTNTSRYTTQTPGWYDIQSTTSIGANATGSRTSMVGINAINRSRKSQMAPCPSGATVLFTGGSVFLNTADYAETQIIQNSGVTVNTSVSGDEMCIMQLRFVSS